MGSGTSRFVDVDGMSVHYRDEGAGPPLLLIHGTGASLHTWDAWSAALSGTHRVVRLDLPGFGLTGPQPDGDYRIDTYVDMVDHFATKVGLDRFALAGNSLGGQIAWRFAARHPEAVNALILVDAAGYPRSVKPPLVFRLGRVPVVSSLMGHLDPHMLVESTLKRTYGIPRASRRISSSATTNFRFVLGTARLSARGPRFRSRIARGATRARRSRR